MKQSKRTNLKTTKTQTKVWQLRPAPRFPFPGRPVAAPRFYTENAHIRSSRRTSYTARLLRRVIRSRNPAGLPLLLWDRSCRRLGRSFSHERTRSRGTRTCRDRTGSCPDGFSVEVLELLRRSRVNGKHHAIFAFILLSA